MATTKVPQPDGAGGDITALVADLTKTCNDILKAASRRSTDLKESCKTTIGLFISTSLTPLQLVVLSSHLKCVILLGEQRLWATAMPWRKSAEQKQSAPL